MTTKTQDPKTVELSAWTAATDAAALAPANDPETARINRAAGDAIEATHNLPGGWYSDAGYEARAGIWRTLARNLTARRYSAQVDPARTAKAHADEAIRAAYAAGRTPSSYAKSCYRSALENLQWAEQNARDAAGGIDNAQERQRAAANLPRHATAAIVQFGETVSNL